MLKNYLKTSLPLFPAGVVGSLSRPHWVRDLVNSTPDTPSRSRRLDEAVASVIAMQETAGLDIVTDGEWRRKSYVGIAGDVLEGLEPFRSFRSTTPISVTS